MNLSIHPRVFSSANQMAFVKFHFANPEVEGKLAKMALDLRDSGIEKWSLWSTLRDTHILSEQTDQYKMANGHIAYYARLIMEDYPVLDGFFMIRGRVELPPIPRGDAIISHKMTLEGWCLRNDYDFPV